MTTSNDIQINIPCNPDDLQRRSRRKALEIAIGTKSWRAKFAARQGRHVDEQKHLESKARLQQQLDELE